MPEAERLLTTGGVSVVARGEGEPVFLMHGIGGNAKSCAQLAGILSDHGYRTLCWDAPGYGLSNDVEPPVDHVRRAKETIQELASGPVHVFGTSWGGVIGTLLAAQHPELVLSLTLADSTRGSGIDERSSSAMRGRVDELERLGASAFAEARSPRLTAKDAPEAVRGAVRRTMAEVRTGGYAAAAEMMASTDTSSALTDITAPTLVLVGAEDVVTGVEESRVLAQTIPGAGFRVFDRAGHAALQEVPLEMAEAMLGAWQKLPGLNSDDGAQETMVRSHDRRK